MELAVKKGTHTSSEAWSLSGSCVFSSGWPRTWSSNVAVPRRTTGPVSCQRATSSITPRVSDMPATISKVLWSEASVSFAWSTTCAYLER